MVHGQYFLLIALQITRSVSRDSIANTTRANETGMDSDSIRDIIIYAKGEFAVPPGL
jgi:hypothetical protein